MNPANHYDVHGAARQACTLLNCGIDELNANKLDQGRKTMQAVIRIISGMNEYYDNNHLLRVNNDGTKTFNNGSAAYNYSWNTRNIKKLEECIHLLDRSDRNVQLVIDVLKGDKELPNSSKI